MKKDSILSESSRKKLMNWSLVLKVSPYVLAVALLKWITHKYGLEVMELNALFTSLVAGTIFLIGFLISGVLSDYKESEKIPTEMAASLRTLWDDTYTVFKTKNSHVALRFLAYQEEFAGTIIDWLYKKERTSSMLHKISLMNDFFVDMDKEGVQANYIIKMKNEQNSLRKLVMRVDTIRDTEFVGSAYVIVETMGALVALGLLVIKIEPVYASLFLTLVVTFLIFYMFLLIKDLDNPFDYRANGESGTEISLKPLHDLESLYKLAKFEPAK